MVEKDSKNYPIFTKVHEKFKAELLRVCLYPFLFSLLPSPSSRYLHMQSEQGLDVLKMLMTQNELMNFLSGAVSLLTSINKIRQKKVILFKIGDIYLWFSLLLDKKIA